MVFFQIQQGEFINSYGCVILNLFLLNFKQLFLL